MKCKCENHMETDIEGERYICECGNEIKWGGNSNDDDDEMW